MIQQQIKGTGLLATAGEVMSMGPGTIWRGTIGMAMREGIYAGGFLGVIPVARETVMKQYPDLSADQARLLGTMIAGPICSMLSHPPDTIKTCLQGDVEMKKFKDYGQTMRTLAAERGVASLWAGAPWRIFRQFCCFILFDKINTDLV